MATVSSTTGATTVSGVGSGIDTASIVSALVAAEKAPKQSQITAQKTTTNATLSAIGSVKSALDTYRTALSKLNTTNSFIGLSATSSSPTVATATIGAKAAAGSYSLVVNNLATASKVTSAKVEGGASTVMNTDATTLTLTQGTNAYTIDIPANSTLQTVRDTINTSLQAKGITANLVTDANGDSRLVMTSTTTGANTEMSLSGIPALAIDGTVAGGTDGAGRIGAAPVDASFTVDGLPLTSASNTVDSAISGVTLSLVGGDSKETTITVGSSTTDLKANVQAFVDAYNALMTVINTQTKVTSTGASSSTSTTAATTAAALTGDSTMRNLVSSIRSELTKPGESGSLSVLSQIGITTTQTTGLLTLDSTKFDNAMKTSSGDVVGLFTGENGILNRMTAATDSYAETGGILASKQKTLNNKLSDLVDDQAALDLRITNLTATLSAKYNAMDTLVAQIKATSDSILTTLNALNNQSSD